MAKIIRRFSPFIVVALPLALAACTDIVGHVEPEPGRDRGGCHSALGAYALPKKLMRITTTKGTSPGFTAEVTAIAAAEPPSRLGRTLCLDFLSNAMSEDMIAVKRDQNGLLTGVSTKATDKTPDIIDRLTAKGVNQVFARSASVAEASETVSLTYDPFDPVETETVQSSLARFGLCGYLEGVSFDPRRITPEQWCQSSRKAIWSDPALPTVIREPLAPDAENHGILYRPNQTYRFVLYRQSDPRASGWLLYKTQSVDLPNASPVLSVGVSRALFTTRSTSLVFQGGVLTDVTIEKGSEALEFARLPLSIVQAALSIPTEIVQLQITNTSARADLVKAESQLLQSRANLINAISARNAAAAESQRSLSLPRSARVGPCLDAGGTEVECRASYQPVD